MVIVNGPVSWVRIMFQVRGTILRRIWGRVAVVGFVALSVTLWHYLAGPLEATLTTTPFSLVGLALSIVLGFRNGKCFERYWEARTLWGGLINTCRTFTRQVLTLMDPPATAMPVEGEREKVERTQRLLVLRTCAFAHALRINLRGSRDLTELERLLGKEEVAAISAAPNQCFALAMAMGERLAHARRQGWVHPMHVPLLDQSVTDLVAIQGGCERIKNTPMPYAYSLLIHRLVGLYCLALPFGIIDSVKGFTPLVVALVAYAFLGLDGVGDEIEDPFGTDDQDLPLTQLSTMIEINLRERLGDTDLPAPVQPVDGILQ